MAIINKIKFYSNYDCSFAKCIFFADLICMCLNDKMRLNGDLTM